MGYDGQSGGMLAGLQPGYRTRESSHRKKSMLPGTHCESPVGKSETGAFASVWPDQGLSPLPPVNGHFSG
jgi:hypothetical protein